MSKCGSLVGTLLLGLLALAGTAVGVLVVIRPAFILDDPPYVLVPMTAMASNYARQFGAVLAGLGALVGAVLALGSDELRAWVLRVAGLVLVTIGMIRYDNLTAQPPIFEEEFIWIEAIGCWAVGALLLATSLCQAHRGKRKAA